MSCCADNPLAPATPGIRQRLCRLPLGGAALGIAVSSLASLAALPALAQAPPPAPADTPAIPAGEWDDDWWYPEGSIRLFGQRFSLMVGSTVTRFTSAAARSEFGTPNVDPSIDLYRPEVGAGLSADFDFLWTGITRTGKRAGFIAPTIGVRYAPLASTRDHWLVPFVGVHAGPYFASTSTSGNATVVGANASFGVDIARRLSLRARYDWLRSVRGHDLSTMGLDITIRIPPFASQRARPKMHDYVPPPGRMVDVGGRRMHLVCLGAGSPTVVLDAGMSDAWVVWDRLLPELARIARVCAYDRAGIGYSDPGPPPRDSRSIVRELHDLLERGGVAPPYVLVGHSFGGYNVRLFAAEHRDEVAGIVLVDATHEDIWNRYPPEVRDRLLRATEAFRAAAELGEQGLALPPVVPNLPLAVASRPAWYRTLYEEGRASQASAEELRGADRRLDVPLVVVTAGRSVGGGPARRAAARMRETWRELQADLARLSPRGEQVIAERSGHYVMRSAPQVVIDAVRRVVEAARRSP